MHIYIAHILGPKAKCYVVWMQPSHWGLRASGWSLILLDYENVATGVVCSY